MGFDVIDARDLAASVHLEALVALWVHLALSAGYGRSIALANSDLWQVIAQLSPNARLQEGRDA